MRISILGHRLEKRLSCTQSFVHFPNFHIHLHTFKIERSLFYHSPTRLESPTFPVKLGGGAGGIFNMVWNPHSSLAGCSAGCYAIIFAHFAELGLPGGGRDWQLPTGEPRLRPPEPEVEWRFFWGQEMT